MPAPPRLTRRSALAGALGATLGGLALAGCDADDLKPHDATPSADPTATADAPTADEALVSAAIAQIQVALAAVVACRRVHALREPLQSLLHTHRAHLTLLQPGSKLPTNRSRPASRPLTALVAAETALQQQLTDAAVRAESGALARVFASMSASIAQHLASAPLATGAPA